MKHLFASVVCAMSLNSGAAVAADAFFEPAPLDTLSSSVPEADPLLGVLKYRGGYVNKMQIVLATPTLVKKFQVKLPTFCDDVEVLEAGTTVGTIDDVATPTTADQDTFLVNSGAGLRITALWITLNGPVAAQCDIPVVDSSTSINPNPVTNFDGTYYQIGGRERLVIAIERGAIADINLGLVNPRDNTMTPVVPTSALMPQAGPMDYTVFGYVDLPVRDAFGRLIPCRGDVRLDFTFFSGRPGMNLRFSYPRSGGIDAAGRCFTNGRMTEQYTFQRVNS